MKTPVLQSKNSMIAAAHRSAMAGIASTTTVATTSVSAWELVALISIRSGIGRTRMA
ncbi:MAG: hypothetical protein ACK5RJ_03350 [Burkholderiales bacterium]|nr:hypothetical protein [Rhodocyclaceae bacterium]MCA3054378.1 hypothetical protein [Rhodocyclaceae bacterium]